MPEVLDEPADRGAQRSRCVDHRERATDQEYQEDDIGARGKRRKGAEVKSSPADCYASMT